MINKFLALFTGSEDLDSGNDQQSELINTFPTRADLIDQYGYMYFEHQWIGQFANYYHDYMTEHMQQICATLLEEMSIFADAELTPIARFNTKTGGISVTSMERINGEFIQ